ncbi:hypothetical protein Premu_0306 [Hallella multisaccharivorax DSM 17128]|uniref:Uncharacterized protein n=1 Tax=Hallella multisaccharivorax DSM 17128 TaxID=688246 RepID=F8NA60_9BACT|nr:hypothetical protein Premu_0306 [Hallella multisaccharivorax DSM 17128]
MNTTNITKELKPLQGAVSPFAFNADDTLWDCQDHPKYHTVFSTSKSCFPCFCKPLITNTHHPIPNSHGTKNT